MIESFGWAHERLRSYIEALTEELVEVPVKFFEFDRGGAYEMERPMWELLLSVGSHGIGHRGEVAALPQPVPAPAKSTTPSSPGGEPYADEVKLEKTAERRPKRYTDPCSEPSPGSRPA